MRDFFINSFEKLVAVLLIIMMIGVAIAGIGAMIAPAYSGGGFWRGLMILIGGGLYIVVVGGSLYLFLGIYQNTAETNRLLRKLTENK